jgi:hypothetical protein
MIITFAQSPSTLSLSRGTRWSYNPGAWWSKQIMALTRLNSQRTVLLRNERPHNVAKRFPLLMLSSAKRTQCRSGSCMEAVARSKRSARA